MRAVLARSPSNPRARDRGASSPRLARGRNARRRPRLVPAFARSKDPTSTSPPTAASDSSPFSFTVDVKVRDSELDQFNVVNNANYSVYLQHARHEFLEHLGLPVAAATKEGGALALSRLDLRFRRPLVSGDVARCGVRVTRATGARVSMEQWVDAVRGDGGGGFEVRRALDAVAEVVALDGSYRPKRLPRAVVVALETGRRVPEGTRWFSEAESSGPSGSDSDE